MALTPLNRLRARFKKRRLAQARSRGVASITLDIQGLEEALANAQAQVDEAKEQIPQLVAQRIAEDIVADKSDWPVDTSYSRSRFEGTERGIENDADYAKYVEDKYSKASDYVNQNIERIADEVVGEIRGEN